MLPRPAVRTLLTASVNNRNHGHGWRSGAGAHRPKTAKIRPMNPPAARFRSQVSQVRRDRRDAWYGRRTRRAAALLLAAWLSGAAAAVAARDVLTAPGTFEATFVTRFATHLCEPEYMQCLGADRATCRAAVAASPRACPLGTLYEAVARPYATAGHQQAAITDASIALGDCVTARVERALALRFDDFPRCFDEFEARSSR